jgi:hypothetical protein
MRNILRIENFGEVHGGVLCIYFSAKQENKLITIKPEKYFSKLKRITGSTILSNKAQQQQLSNPVCNVINHNP